MEGNEKMSAKVIPRCLSDADRMHLIDSYLQEQYERDEQVDYVHFDWDSDDDWEDERRPAGGIVESIRFGQALADAMRKEQGEKARRAASEEAQRRAKEMAAIRDAEREASLIVQQRAMEGNEMTRQSFLIVQQRAMEEMMSARVIPSGGGAVQAQGQALKPRRLSGRGASFLQLAPLPSHSGGQKHTVQHLCFGTTLGH